MALVAVCRCRGYLATGKSLSFVRQRRVHPAVPRGVSAFGVGLNSHEKTEPRTVANLAAKSSSEIPKVARWKHMDGAALECEAAQR